MSMKLEFKVVGGDRPLSAIEEVGEGGDGSTDSATRRWGRRLNRGWPTGGVRGGGLLGVGGGGCRVIMGGGGGRRVTARGSGHREKDEGGRVVQHDPRNTKATVSRGSPSSVRGPMVKIAPEIFAKIAFSTLTRLANSPAKWET
jgi:hypothetical protein